MIVAEALLVGLAIGAILGLIGAGGAVVAVPAFLYLFGLDPLQATTASLAVVAAAAATGAVPRLRLGQVRTREALVFWSVGIVGTLIGSRLVHVVPGVVIIVGFAVVMAGAAVAMWRKSSRADSGEPTRRGPWLLPVVAISVGILTGLFGVGGGFLVVPALVLVYGLPFAVATGTSLVVVALNSVTALGFRFDTWGDISWQVPGLVVIGGVIGALVASSLNHGISQRLLERSFAGLLLLLAGGMVTESVVSALS
ncbi:MAG: sulfite exporter TauE/SafE family protein [Actinomycetota bacterium]|nr:sulfite exporter TauE/SafE family protein [Actinomycetota bacterium]